jgi:hypothetical protein
MKVTLVEEREVRKKPRSESGNPGWDTSQKRLGIKKTIDGS